jgi:hypothetical protein
VNIVTKSVKDLTPIEYKACYSANYGDGGYMRFTLVEIRNGTGGEGTAIMLWDGPNDSVRNMIGWALITPVSLTGWAAGTRYTKRKSKYTAQFWVKRPHRKKGHATTLMNEVKKYDERPHVFPHSDASGEFFSGYKVTAAKAERTWLRNGKPKVA